MGISAGRGTGFPLPVTRRTVTREPCSKCPGTWQQPLFRGVLLTYAVKNVVPGKWFGPRAICLFPSTGSERRTPAGMSMGAMKVDLAIASGNEGIVADSALYLVTIQELVVQFPTLARTGSMSTRHCGSKGQASDPHEVAQPCAGFLRRHLSVPLVIWRSEKGSTLLTLNSRAKCSRTTRDRLGHPGPTAHHLRRPSTSTTRATASRTKERPAPACPNEPERKETNPNRNSPYKGIFRRPKLDLWLTVARYSLQFPLSARCRTFQLLCFPHHSPGLYGMKWASFRGRILNRVDGDSDRSVACEIAMEYCLHFVKYCFMLFHYVDDRLLALSEGEHGKSGSLQCGTLDAGLIKRPMSDLKGI